MEYLRCLIKHATWYLSCSWHCELVWGLGIGLQFYYSWIYESFICNFHVFLFQWWKIASQKLQFPRLNFSYFSNFPIGWTVCIRYFLGFLYSSDGQCCKIFWRTYKGLYSCLTLNTCRSLHIFLFDDMCWCIRLLISQWNMIWMTVWFWFLKFLCSFCSPLQMLLDHFPCLDLVTLSFLVCLIANLHVLGMWQEN